MKLRRAIPADDERLRELWNRASLFDPLMPSLFAEKVRADVDAMTLLADEGGQPIGFVTVVARALPEELRGIVKLIAVASEHHRRGVGTALLRAAEEELTLRGASSIRVGESFPNYLTPGVDVRYAPALKFFASQGYAPFAEAVNLEVDLLQWQAGRASHFLLENTEIRLATRAESSTIDQFISTHWPPWWGEVSQALSNNPATLLLAWQGTTLVGFAAHDANNRGTGWFGPMGTAPEVRGQGIGVALLHAALEGMLNAGHHRATIPWVGPVEFYQRHAGATLSRTFQRFQKLNFPT